MFDPWRWLSEQGVTVDYRPLPPDTLGEWWPDHHTVVIDPTLTARQERCTVAHEAGHVALNHTGCGEHDETAADEWAAARLLTDEMFAGAERLYGRDPAAMGEELDLMPWVIRAYRRLLERRRWDRYFTEDLIA